MQQKKADDLAIDNRRYGIYKFLDEQFFSPLRKDFINYIQSYNFILPVKFSIHLHEQSSIYTRGIKHLEPDIDDFQNKLNSLKKDTDEYNKILDDFEKEEIYKLLSYSFEQN